MKVVVWLAEGTWQAGVDASRRFVPPEAEVTLLHVVDPRWASGADAAQAGLLGRGRRHGDVGDLVASTALAAEESLLDAAARRLGRGAARDARRGQVEREVVAAAADADLLVLARDGDERELGPGGLGRQVRYVLDHAPCPVLLVWPGDLPAGGPAGPPRHPQPPGHRPPHPPR